MAIIYQVDIDAYVMVAAESKEEAIEQVKQKFKDEELTWDDLIFTCDDGFQEDEE